MPLDFTKGSISRDFAEKVVGGALDEDVEGEAKSEEKTNESSDTYYRGRVEEGTLVSKTLDFDANSLAFAVGFACVRGGGVERYLGLYMGGVEMQTTSELDRDHSLVYILRDFKALSGSQVCLIDNVSNYIYSYGHDSSSEFAAAIAVGSVKLA